MTRTLSPNHFSEPVLNFLRTDVVRIRLEDTVAEALARAQRSAPGGRIVYFYVVDAEDRLQGVLPTRGLLLSPPHTPVAEIMVKNVVALPDTATLLDACEFFMLHRLLALPVVDDQRRLLGVVDVEIYTDEISDLARRDEAQSVFQLIGVRLATVRHSLAGAVRGRFPWLLANIAGGLGCAALAAAYEQTLERTLVLAMFIPLVLTLAESVAIQSLTLALSLPPRFRWSSALRAVRRETAVGAALGIATGTLVGAIAGVWWGSLEVAFTILAALVLALTTATLFGLSVPTLLRAVARDPKVASGPLALALTDIATLFWYLLAARLLLAG